VKCLNCWENRGSRNEQIGLRGERVPQMNSEQEVQVCDAREVEKRTKVDNKKNLTKTPL